MPSLSPPFILCLYYICFRFIRQYQISQVYLFLQKNFFNYILCCSLVIMHITMLCLK
nr:MAG TPA: hypothetical protein [Caudoviricetes sp.]